MRVYNRSGSSVYIRRGDAVCSVRAADLLEGGVHDVIARAPDTIGDNITDPNDTGYFMNLLPTVAGNNAELYPRETENNSRNPPVPLTTSMNLPVAVRIPGGCPHPPKGEHDCRLPACRLCASSRYCCFISRA